MRHHILAELARAALRGASLSELIPLAIEAGVRETGLQAAVLRQALAAATPPPNVPPEDRAFVDGLAGVLALAGAREQAAAEAARHAETVRALIDSASEMIVRFDRALRCLAVNPAAERLTGHAEADWLGRRVCDLPLAEAVCSALLLGSQSVVRTGREQTLEASLPTLHGERDVEIRVVPEWGPSGEIDAILTVWRDVTQQVRAEAERTRLYAEVVRGQAEVRELLGRVLQSHAHDLQVVAARADADRLTGREREILRLLTAGWSNREIADRLGLQAGTVKNHVARILTKLDVRDRIQAAVRAVELGLVDPNSN
jgi:PAS domain S-box-containing protein